MPPPAPAPDWGDFVAGYRSPPPPPPDVRIPVSDGGDGAPRRRAAASVAKPPETAGEPAGGGPAPPSPPSAQADWEDGLLRELLAAPPQGGARGARPRPLAAAARWACDHGMAAAVMVAGAATAALVGAAAPRARALGVPAWRLPALAAVLPALWLASGSAITVALAAADGRLARSTAALFLLAGVRAPLQRLLRAAAITAALALASGDYGGNSPAHPVLAACAKLATCGAVAAAASLAARLAAASLAASLYARSHADRVQDALDKEFMLFALSQPRRAPRAVRAAAEVDAPPTAVRAPASLFRMSLPRLANRCWHRLSTPAPPAEGPLLGGQPQQPHARHAAPPECAPNVCAPPPASTAARVAPGAALAALEAHIRENRLRVPLADVLGGAAPEPAPTPTAADSTLSGLGSPASSAPSDARLLALYLFWHVRGPAARGWLERGDLTPFFLDAARADAAWRLLDPASTGRAPAAAVRTAVADIHTQRATLAAALAGARGAAASLERALAAAAHAMALFAYCAVWGFDPARVLLTASSALVATAFIFGNTARSVFESAAFVYGVHAFDVGDVLLVDGVWHQVREKRERGEREKRERAAVSTPPLLLFSGLRPRPAPHPAAALGRRPPVVPQREAGGRPRGQRVEVGAALGRHEIGRRRHHARRGARRRGGSGQIVLEQSCFRVHGGTPRRRQLCGRPDESRALHLDRVRPPRRRPGPHRARAA